MADQIKGDLANFIARQADINALENDLQFVREHVDDLGIGVPKNMLSLKEDCIAYSDVQAGDSRGSDAITPEQVKKLNMKVGIIGGGVAGLYTAMLLEWLHIDCEIVEAADRLGGRIHTHPFDKDRAKPQAYGKNPNEVVDKDYEPNDFEPSTEPGNYYDVGAMRFPDIPIMARTFDLFKRLGMEKKKDRKDLQPGDLIPYILFDKSNPRFYNEKFNTIDTLKEAEDKFDAGDKNVEDLIGISSGYKEQHNIPKDIILRGSDKLLGEILQDWKERFKDDPKKTFDDLMERDRGGLTMRMVMMQHLGKEYKGHKLTDTQRYNIIQWCETMGAATNHYDEAFFSVVLHSLEFEWAPDASDIIGSYGVPVDRWWCVYGGTENLIPKMKKHIRKVNKDFCPMYMGHRVVRLEEIEAPGAREDEDKYKMKMHLRVKNKTELQEKTFSHVICTTTTPCLQTMDLRDAGLTYAQREAIRCLRYDNSVKVGIRFKRRWWAEKDCTNPITGGGVGYTDRPTRVTVYPSYTLDKEPTEAPVLLACYNWAQDAARIGHLIKGSDPTDQQAVLDVVIADLAAMHFADKDQARKKEIELHSLVDKYHVHDWYHYEHTGGAFGMFGPGQFGAMFPYLRQPAADGHLFFAGEITSIYHGWVVASLNSARRAVEDLLLSRASTVQGKDEENQELVLTMRATLQEEWGKVEEVENDEQTRRWQMVINNYKKDIVKRAGMSTVRSDS